jgi:hypothetical protein
MNVMNTHKHITLTVPRTGTPQCPRAVDTHLYLTADSFSEIYRQLNVLAANRIKVTTYLVRFEVFTAVTMKNGVFWDVTPCGSCKNRRSLGT